jgi:hypothetical protein
MSSAKCHSRVLVVFAALALTTPSLHARVISYAAVTDRQSEPAIQKRTNRFFALVEVDSASGPACGGCVGNVKGRLVLYDSSGERERRVVLPADGSSASIYLAAVWEGDDHVPRLFVSSDANVAGENPDRQRRYLVSADAGVTWHPLRLPDGRGGDLHPSLLVPSLSGIDHGGPLVRGRAAAIRFGTAEYPFVVAFRDLNASGRDGVYAVRPDGTSRLVFQHDALSVLSCTVVGSDREGARFLVAGVPVLPDTFFAQRGLWVVDLAGSAPKQIPFPWGDPLSVEIEGWITPQGGAYLDMGLGIAYRSDGVLLKDRRIGFSRESGASELARLAPVPGPWTSAADADLYAIPTADFSGAWLAQFRPDAPTTLWRHSPGSPIQTQWTDAASPQAEALHAGESGQRLMIQVHRPRRVSANTWFVDPALAIWDVSQPAPARYDELYLNEQDKKGFVHLDVDAAAEGGNFYFNSGNFLDTTGGGGPSGGDGGGGGDVVQEWGVVKASLAQRLLIPSVARAGGSGSSFWQTDVILRNPENFPIFVGFEFAPNGGSRSGDALGNGVHLGAGEIRIVPDVLETVLHLESGFGSLFLHVPTGASVEATTRTYTSTARGRFGMGVGAVEVATGAVSGFPLTFSAGLLGEGYRTNLVLADVSGRGSQASLRLASQLPGSAPAAQTLTTPVWGPIQLNSIESLWETAGSVPGSFLLEPTSGAIVPMLVSIDNTTNDPTYFPPDLASSTARVIPAIVHQSGANGAMFQSDLFLFNPSNQTRSVSLAMVPWDDQNPYAQQALNLPLLPFESRTIKDVLARLFGRSGVAKLSFQSGTGFMEPSTNAVRVTSRTYTTDASGGTYGMLLPPLNSFQSVGPGETLEILGPIVNANFRTNLSLVELSPAWTSSGRPSTSADIEISDSQGIVRDRFTMSVPTSGGTQLNDVLRSWVVADGVPEAFLIRITSVDGQVGAYATLIDQGTNDPTYFAAILAAR